MSKSIEIQKEIVMNVGKEVDEKTLDALCNKDVQHSSLFADLKRAEMNQQFFKARIIERQLSHRRSEIMTQEVQRRIIKYVNSGHILKYLPHEQLEKLDRATTMVLLLLNAVDSALVDAKGVYEECGFGPGELYDQHEVNEIRKKVQTLYYEKELSQHVISDIINDEADRIYNNLRERFDIVRRKCEKAVLRKQKENEAK